VYLETQFLEALPLSGEVARRKLAELGKPVEGLDFTRDGMEAFLHGARPEYYRGLIERRAGDPSAARVHWETGASGRGIFAILAAKELGRSDWRDRANQLASEERSASAERGLALLAIGRTDEGRQVLDDCLRAPDRNLSHYLARRALLYPGVQ
jgi:hypothetical protein